MIFIDKQNRVASIHANARPMDETQIRSNAAIDKVLEINAGLAAAKGIRVGTKVTIEKE